MATTAVSVSVGSVMSLADRVKGWLRRSERSVSHGLEALEGRQLMSVPTLNPVGPQLGIASGASTPAGVSVTVDGSFVLAWMSNTEAGQGIAAQQVFKGMGPSDLLDVSGYSLEGSNFMPSVAHGSDGGFLVVWNGSEVDGPMEIFGRAYDAEGVARGAAFEIGSTPAGSASMPEVTGLEEGGYVVTWYQTAPDEEVEGGSLPVGVFAQAFTNIGTEMSSVLQVSTNVDSRGMTLPRVEEGVEGEFAISWMREDREQGVAEIFLQRMSPDGKKWGGATLMVEAPAVFEAIGGHSPTYSFDIDQDGNYLFAWDQTSDGEPWNVFGRYYDSYLKPLGDAVRISGESDYSQFNPSVGFAPNGSAVVIWEGVSKVEDENGRVVRAAQLGDQTHQVESSFDVSSTLDGYHGELKPALGLDGFGGFTAAWAGYNGAMMTDGSMLIIRTFEAVEAAEITVTGDGEAVENGSTKTSHDNYTDFGDVDSDGGYHEHEFEISNGGNIALEFGEFEVPEGFTLVSTPGMLEPGETGTLRIALSGEAGIGLHTGVVSIPNNVEGMDPFTFTITGDVLERKTVTFNKSTPLAERTFIDEEGNTVVFALTGPGFGSISFNPRTHVLFDLDLEETTRASNLTINVSKTKGMGTGFTALEDVYVHGSLNAFSAGKVDLYGDFEVKGTLASLVMRDVVGEDEHFVDIGGSINTRTDFTFRRINDLHLETDGYTGMFKAVDWLDLNDELDEFFTGSIISMNITGQAKTATQEFAAGDISVDIFTYNTGRPLGQPGVGSITVAGEVYDCTWDLQGYIGAISLGSADDSHFIFEDGFGSFTVWGEVVDSSLLAGYEDEDGGDNEDGFVGAAAGTITVGGWDGGEINANTIVSFSAVARAAKTGYAPTDGGVIDMDVYAQGFDLADNALAIKSFKAAGFVNHVDLKSLGNVGTVWLGKDAEVFHVHGEDGGDLRSFTVVGKAIDCMVNVNGNIDTIQVAHWTGGSIEAKTLNLLNVTGRAKSAMLPALTGDIDAQVILHGNLDKRNGNTLGTLRVAGMLHGVDGREHDIQVTGSVGSVTSGSLERLAFSVYAYFGGPQVKIGSVTTGYTDYWDITAPGVAIGSITVAQWHDGHLYADKIGTLRVTGRAASAGKAALPADFFGLIDLDGTVTTTGNLLASAVISGLVMDSEWDINGNAGNVTVEGADEFELTVKGNLNSYVVQNHVMNESNVKVEGVLQSLRAGGWSGSDIVASKIGSILISSAQSGGGLGDFMGGVYVTGVGQASTAVLLGSMTVAKMIGSSVIRSPGHVGSIRVGSFMDTSVFVGVNEGFAVGELPMSKSDFTNPSARLQSFTVTSNRDDAFTIGRVAAGELVSVSIGLVSGMPGDDRAFGFSAATKIGSYRRLKMIGIPTPVVVVNKTLPGIYDDGGLYRLQIVALDAPPVG